MHVEIKENQDGWILLSLVEGSTSMGFGFESKQDALNALRFARYVLDNDITRLELNYSTVSSPCIVCNKGTMSLIGGYPVHNDCYTKQK